MTDFQKGDTVTLRRAVYGRYPSGYGGRNFANGTTATVNSVRKNDLTIRLDSYNYYKVDRDAIEGYQNMTFVPKPKVAKPKPRPLGQVPEGSIPQDDPRIAYIWEDAARAAQKAGYCSAFDRIADEINVPGRERDITTTATINGVRIQATVKARSTSEAKAKITAALATPATAPQESK